ncbi:MAG: peptidoglycan DD-metalloendopeptidase family protein, partial [Hyphomicrobiales bacterium]
PYGESSNVSTTSLPDPTVSSPRYGSQASSSGVVTVAGGDTLYSIARANNVGVQDLISTNGLTAPYSLSVGQRLRLPGAASSSSSTVASSAPAQSGSGGSTHTVKNGETLYSLGRTYSMNPMSIARHNSLSAPYSLSVGQRVSIPSGGTVANVQSTTDNTVATAKDAAGDAASNTAQKTAAATPTPTQLPTPTQRSSSGFRWPVKGRVLSSYGPKSNGSRNDGINIAVPEGTSVRAAENGVVAYAGNELKGYGNLVLIRHEGGWVTAYAHNQVLHVKRGDKISRGDVIGKAGSTGNVSSPQVHFEIRKGAEAVDPMKHLSSNVAGG